MKRQTVSVVLSVLLTLSALAPRACNEDQVKRVKQAVEDIIIYSNAAQQVLTDFKAAGVLPAERADRDIEVVKRIRAGAEVFLERAASYEKFDAAVRGELRRLFQDVIGGIRDLQARGFTIIQDEQRRLRISTIITTALALAEVIESRLR